MTVALPDVPLLGSDEPRIITWPKGMVSSAGPEMVDWGRQVGMAPLRWQEIALELIGAETGQGHWAATEDAIGAPRQNGKGLVYEVRGLAGIFVFGEKRVLYSAHRLDTAMEFYKRVKETIDNHDDLRSRIKAMREANGQVQIETRMGTILKIMSRVSGAGRGMSPEVLLVDEAQILSPVAMRALTYAQSAQGRKIKRIFMGTPPELDKLEHGEQFRIRRDRGRAGDGKRFGYAEWSEGQVWPSDPAEQEKLCRDRQGWARANPALGPEDGEHLILEDTIEDELAAAAAAGDWYGFARERLWMWPSGAGGGMFTEAEWDSLYDAFSRLTSHKVIALDMGPDRAWIRVAIASPDAVDPERVHVEYLGEFRPAELERQLRDRLPVHKPIAVMIDNASPVASYKAKIATVCQQLGCGFTVTNTTEHVEACGLMYDVIKPGASSEDRTEAVDADGHPVDLQLSHIGQDELMLAFTSMSRRKVGNRFAFGAAGGGDISAGIAATIAVWGVINTPRRRSAYEDGGVFTV